MAIFLITGNACEARDLAQDLSPRQVLQGHDDVKELISWLKEARKLATGHIHWSVWGLPVEHVSQVAVRFPMGHVIHFHMGSRATSKGVVADYFLWGGAGLG